MALNLGSDNYQQRRRVVQGALGACLVLAVLITGCLFILLKPVHADSINTTDFVFTIKTDNGPNIVDDGCTSCLYMSLGNTAEIDWNNDGIFDETGSFYTYHDFGSPGEYTIRVKGQTALKGILADSKKVIDVKQWGITQWQDVTGAFNSASNIYSFSATDMPNLSMITSMYTMFVGATNFNGNISNWDVSNVTNMRAMFQNTASFNGDLSSWDVSNVTDMSYMFLNATGFNGDISNWDVSNVASMSGVFHGAANFNRDLSNWDMTTVLSMDQMLSDSGMSQTNYNATLAGWSSQSVHHDVALGADGLEYCTSSARDLLVNTYSWDITGDTKTCSLLIDNTSIHAGSPVGTSVGTLSVTNFTLRASLPYTLTCAVPGVDDSSFAIGGAGNDELLTGNIFDYDMPSDTNGDNIYEVCVRATDANGNVIDQTMMITVTPALPEKIITDVNFPEFNGKQLLTVTGTGLVGETNPAEYGDALARSLVKLNGTDLPFCADGVGFTAQEIVDQLGVAPSLVSDDPSCYFLIENGTDVVITPTQAQIWLPDNFDITAEGTVSVNGSNTYTFNPSSSGPTTPTLNVNGNGPINQMPTIPKRPTFSGVAEPGSTITVTVQSDPVVCTATADSSGNWSCTLPSDLAPGIHTVTVVVTSPDGLTSITLGPYSVMVGGTITNNTPLAPNTGFLQLTQQYKTAKHHNQLLPAILAGVSVAVGLAVAGFIVRKKRSQITFSHKI